MSQLEKDIERKLCKAVERAGGHCLKWVCPGWAGVPDRIVLLPAGRIVFVELKRPEGRLAALQAWWANKIQELGFTYCQIWSDQQLAEFKRTFL